MPICSADSSRLHLTVAALALALLLPAAAVQGQDPPDKPAATNATPEMTPLLTVTHLASAPVIDGVIHGAEWATAAGTTGFFELGTVRQAERQTEILLGFDEEHLFIAFISKQKALQLRGGGTGYNTPFGNDMEGVEIWLKPPGRGYLQWLGVPAGGTLESSEDPALNGWSRAVRFASRVEDSGEMMGGTLTLGKKTWTGEIAIPFKAIGVPAPADGDLWRLNICRDFSVPSAGQARLNSDWTTWAPLRSGFAEVNGFGHAQFLRQAPAFRLQSLGELSTGTIDLQGVSGGGVAVETRVVLEEAPEQLVTELTTQLKEAGPFQIKDSIKTAAVGLTRMRLLLTAADSARGAVLARAQIPLELRPTFWIQPRLFYSAHRLDVAVDASRAADVPPGGSTEVGLWNPEAPQALIQAKEPLEPNRQQFQMSLDVAGLAPGSYALKGFIRNAQGEAVASTTEAFRIPARPAWLGNRLGLSEEVPPPFSPVVVDGHTVSLVMRQYTLGDNGLPVRIVSLGEDILAAPATLTAIRGGQAEAWAFEPLEPLAQTPREARWRIRGVSPALELTGTITVEFDGLGLWDITLTPRGALTLDQLYLEFPIHRESALFAKGDGSVVASLMQDKYTQVPGREDIVTLGNRVTEWGSWSYSRSGWVWPEKFCNEIYVGSDQRGFSVMTETDENVFGTKHAEFIPNPGDIVTLRLNLISTPTTITNKLSYKYFYQTTPLKPEPRDPKAWHVGFDPSSVYTSQIPGYASAVGREFLSALSIGQAYYDLQPDGYPRWIHTPEESVAGLQYFQKLGPKIVHNLWYAAIAAELPEYGLFGSEWDALPKYGWATPQANLTSACLCSTYQDFFIWCTDGIVNDLGFDGVYTDATAVPCSNAAHGCGYLGRDGKRHTTLNLLATRAFAKRMYTILKSAGRDRLNFSHSGESTSAAAFVDVRTHGEELVQEELDHYRRLTPDYFRAKYAQNEYGVPYTFYAVFHYKWRAVGEPVPSSEILMMCLVHRITFGLAYNLEMLPVWKVFDPWWTAAQFIPYWRDDCPSTTADPLNVLASTFLQTERKQALIVVSNWSYQPAHTAVSLDWGKLGFGPAPIQLLDVPNGTATVLTGESPTLDLPARDYRVLLVK